MYINLFILEIMNIALDYMVCIFTLFRYPSLKMISKMIIILSFVPDLLTVICTQMICPGIFFVKLQDVSFLYFIHGNICYSSLLKYTYHVFCSKG